MHECLHSSDDVMLAFEFLMLWSFLCNTDLPQGAPAASPALTYPHSQAHSRRTGTCTSHPVPPRGNAVRVEAPGLKGGNEVGQVVGG